MTSRQTEGPPPPEDCNEPGDGGGVGSEEGAEKKEKKRGGRRWAIIVIIIIVIVCENEMKIRQGETGVNCQQGNLIPKGAKVISHVTSALTTS